MANFCVEISPNFDQMSVWFGKFLSVVRPGSCLVDELRILSQLLPQATGYMQGVKDCFENEKSTKK